MKLVFFITTLLGGGAEKVLSDLVVNLDKSKYDITVITLFNKGVYIDKIKDKVKYRYVFNIKGPKILDKIKYKLGISYFRYFSPKFLWMFCVHRKYDVEVAFMEGISTKIISGSFNSKSKKLAWIHTDFNINSESNAQFHNFKDQFKSYSKFDKIICVSNRTKEAFEERFKIPVQVQYNILNEHEIIAKSQEQPDEKGLFDKFTVISVGRLTQEKGFDRLMHVHKKMIKEGFDYNLLILGEGAEKILLEKIIDENGLNDSVKLLGFKTNPYKYMARSDLFVCSSFVEGFSTAATEAIILGIPVLTTDCSGMHDLLGDSEYGLITENTEEALYEGLKSLLEDKNKYINYKNKAKERSKFFTLSKRIEEIEKLF